MGRRHARRDAQPCSPSLTDTCPFGPIPSSPVLPSPPYCHSERQPRNPNGAGEPGSRYRSSPTLSFRAAAEESQRNGGNMAPSPNRPTLSFRAAAEESQRCGGNHAPIPKPPYPVIPSGSRGIPTAWGNRVPGVAAPFPVIPSGSRGIPTPPTNHPYPLKNTLPSPGKGRERLGKSMRVPLNRWDSSAVARNDRRGGLGKAMKVPLNRWDSSAVARNDRQGGLGKAGKVPLNCWDSSAVARNDRRGGAWQGREGSPELLGFLGCRPK